VPGRRVLPRKAERARNRFTDLLVPEKNSTLEISSASARWEADRNAGAHVELNVGLGDVMASVARAAHPSVSGGPKVP